MKEDSVKVDENSSISEIKEIVSNCNKDNQVVCLKIVEEYFKYKKEKLVFKDEKYECENFKTWSSIGLILLTLVIGYIIGKI